VRTITAICSRRFRPFAIGMIAPVTLYLTTANAAAKNFFCGMSISRRQIR
jgi:hypothetical protein